MSNCPKCGESGLAWVETKNKKHWLKKDLGEGQTGKEWHECSKGGELGSQTEVIHKIRPFCHECNEKDIKSPLIDCDEFDCQLCHYAKSFCTNCDTHVSVVEMK